MSRAIVIPLLWWLVAWNVGAMLEFIFGGPWTLIGIAVGTAAILAIRVRGLLVERPASASGRA